MRFSVCLPMFFGGMPLADAIRRAASLGYDACEMWRVSDTEDLEAAAAACKECGVEFIAICTDEFDMTAGNIERYLAGLKTAAEKARRLHVKRLITQVGNDTGAPRAEQHANIVACLKATTPILEEYDLTLVVEPLNTLVDHNGYFLSSSAEGFAIIREVNHPLVRLLFDIYHQQVTEGNIIANITENLPLIDHLHAAGCPGRHELQDGENDYTRIFEMVDAAGYTGVCALEYKPLLPPEQSLLETKRIYG